MEIAIDLKSYIFTNKRDQSQMSRSEVRASDTSKAARTAILFKRASLSMTFEVEEFEVQYRYRL